MNNLFNIHRFKAFLTYKLHLNCRTWSMQLIAFAGIFILISTLLLYKVPAQDASELYSMFYILTLFPCGLYITSRSYSDLESTSKGFLFMQLPVSLFEKFIVPVVFAGLVFPILFTLYYNFVANISVQFIEFLYGKELQAIPLFNDFNGKVLKIYIPIQSLFLIGSLQFKKQHLLWTAVSIVSVMAVFFALWIFISRLSFGVLNTNVNWFSYQVKLTASGFGLEESFLLFIACFGWLISFYKLKEKEV